MSLRRQSQAQRMGYSAIIAFEVHLNKPRHDCAGPRWRRTTRSSRTTSETGFLLAVSLVLAIALGSAERTCASEPPQRPILRLETGMHTGFIKRMAVDENHGRLVTVSDDKTARVWDLETGRLLRILRPPIGPGYEGQLYAVAAQLPGRLIAMAGWTGLDWEQAASVYLFDANTGEMVRRLSGFPSTIDVLAYSRNGHYLAVGVADGHGLWVYDAGNDALVGRDPDYEGRILGLDFDSKGRVATTSFDGHVRLYDEHFKLIRRSPIGVGRSPMDLAFSPDGGELAVGFFDVPRVAILSAEDLELRHLPDTVGLVGQLNLLSIAWSADGTVLYAAGRYGGAAPTPIYAWRNKGRGKREHNVNGERSVNALLGLKNDGVAYASGEPSLGIIGRPQGASWAKSAHTADFREGFAALWVSDDGMTIRFPYARGGVTPAYFSLARRRLSSKPPDGATLRPPMLRSVGIAVTNWKQYDPTINGRLLSFDRHEQSFCYAIAPGRRHVLFGTDWAVRLFDTQGQLQWIAPVSVEVFAVNVSGNNELAVAALADGTVRWYRLSDGKELLAFFPHKNRKDWVAWTPLGYYVSSPDGDRYIGWHVNRGKDRAADFYPAVPLERTLHRPDLVQEYVELQGDDEAFRKLIGSADFSIQPLARIAPPSVRHRGKLRRDACDQAATGRLP